MAKPPLFGGWTPTYEGDPCGGGHVGHYADENGDERCNRCGRLVDLRRCLCGEETHRGSVARSYCPLRMRFDQRDAEVHLKTRGTAVRYFGEPLDAPVYEGAEQAPTPVGVLCVHCHVPFEESDQGFLIPYLGVSDPDLWEQPWHKDCFLWTVLGPAFVGDPRG